ncbi:MAG TPA: ABC transporter permease [Solirubrobacteraceae bacterium]|nr:ABC transporter permease [Solirubrobacteraceae bacterium]
MTPTQSPPKPDAGSPPPLNSSGRPPAARAVVKVLSVPSSGRNKWILPAVLTIAMFVVIYLRNPSVLNYSGISLLLAASLPVCFATVAQMFVTAAGDLDIAIGSFMGLVTVITVVVMPNHVFLGVLALIGLVCGYIATGLVVLFRRVPAIVATLGMSFVWLGVGLALLPVPGGVVPSGIVKAINLSPPLIPETVLILVVLAVVVEYGMMHTRYGAVLRGVGSNPEAVRSAGWSIPIAKAVLYGLAGIFGVLAGLALSGEATSGDPNLGSSYLFLSIAGVVIGGGGFTGGDIAPAGAVLGGLSMSLLTPLLAITNVSSTYQDAVEGVLLVLILLVKSASTWISSLESNDA